MLTLLFVLQENNFFFLLYNKEGKQFKEIREGGFKEKDLKHKARISVHLTVLIKKKLAIDKQMISVAHGND